MSVHSVCTCLDGIYSFAEFDYPCNIRKCDDLLAPSPIGVKSRKWINEEPRKPKSNSEELHFQRPTTMPVDDNVLIADFNQRHFSIIVHRRSFRGILQLIRYISTRSRVLVMPEDMHASQLPDWRREQWK